LIPIIQKVKLAPLEFRAHRESKVPIFPDLIYLMLMRIREKWNECKTANTFMVAFQGIDAPEDAPGEINSDF
jgi:hypothetical protein